MREVVRKEVLKLLKAGVIYPISDSVWVSLVQVVPKNHGMTVIHNEKNEFIPQWTATGERMCITYRKLNKVTRKDHFPLPFIDEMLEMLANHSLFCYLEWRERLTTVPSYIKNESRPSNSNQEIRYFSLTLVFIYLVMVSFVVSEKTPT
jgi:hypothetical protein